MTEPEAPPPGPAQGPPAGPPATGRVPARSLLLASAGLAALVVLAIAVVMIVAGGDKDRQDWGPREVVTEWVDRAHDGDCSLFELTSNHVLDTDEENRADAIAVPREICESSPEMTERDSSGCVLDVGAETIDGSAASVALTVTGCKDESFNFDGTVRVRKEEGEWRVDEL